MTYFLKKKSVQHSHNQALKTAPHTLSDTYLFWEKHNFLHLFKEKHNFFYRYEDEPTSSGKGISDNYKAIHWTPLNVRLLERFYDTAPLSMQCNQSDGTRFSVRPDGSKLPVSNENLCPLKSLRCDMFVVFIL